MKDIFTLSLQKNSTFFTKKSKSKIFNLTLAVAPIIKFHHIIVTALSLFSSYIIGNTQININQVITNFISNRNKVLSFTLQLIQPAIQLHRKIEATDILTICPLRGRNNKEYCALDCSRIHYSV